MPANNDDADTRRDGTEIIEKDMASVPLALISLLIFAVLGGWAFYLYAAG